MSRRNKALVAVAFTYAQSVLGIVASLFITRLLVRSLGADLYGIWLATGGLLGYAGLADLGIFGVMPWLFAEADGAKDIACKRSLIVHGLLAGVGAGVLYSIGASAIWLLLPHLAHLDAHSVAQLRGPIVVIVVATAVGYPVRLFPALRGGLQDFKFLGVLQLVGTLLNASLSYGLLRAGLGLYAVVIASITPTILTSVCSLIRTWRIDRPLLQELPRPTLRGTRPILTSGAGSWMGSLGWQMASATDVIVIAYLGYRELVPTFAITSRLGLTLMQFAWSLPDSGLIGLANLGAEGNRSRTESVVRTLIRLNLIPIGAVVCVTLAANATLVHFWVGSDLFGGELLNRILILDVLVLTITHALCTPAAVLGSRVQVGVITLVNGVVHIVLALILGHWFSLSGVAIATALSALGTSIPVGIHLLTAMTGITGTSVIGSLILPWLWRALPSVLVAGLAGWVSHSYLVPRGFVTTVIIVGAMTAFTVFVYLWSVRGMIKDLPFGPRITRLLSAVGLVSL